MGNHIFLVPCGSSTAIKKKKKSNQTARGTAEEVKIVDVRSQNVAFAGHYLPHMWQLCGLSWICLNGGDKKEEKIHPAVKIWWHIHGENLAKLPFAAPWSGCTWRLSGCHMQPMNTCYPSSSRVIASFLSRLMGLTFSSTLNVQIILNFSSQWIFSPPPERGPCCGTPQPRSIPPLPSHTSYFECMDF